MLRSFRLVNMCQHELVEHTLGPGLTVVIGPQGSGKTNMLSLAVGSITGDNKLHGNKDENVRRGAESQPAYVETEWEFEGNRYRVVRGYNKKKSMLYRDGEKLPGVSRENEITDTLLAAVKSTKASLWDYSFVQQGKTDELLAAKVTGRIRFMAKLLDMEHILEWSAQVNAALNAVTAKLDYNYRGELVDVLSKHSATKASYTERKNQARFLQLELHAAEQGLATVSDTAAKLEKYREAEARYASDSDRYAKDRQRYVDLHQQLSVLLQNAEKLDAQIASAKKWEAAAKANALRAVKASERDMLDTEIENYLKQLVEPIAPKTTRVTQEELSSNGARLQLFKKRLAAITSNKNRCEACGGSLASTPEDVARVTEAVNDLDKLVAAQSDEFRAWSFYDSALASFNERKQFVEQQLAKARASVVEVEAELAALGPQEAVTSYDALAVQRLPSLEQEAKNALTQSSRMSGELQSLYTLLVETEQRLKAERQALDTKQVELANFDEAKAKQLAASVGLLRVELQAALAEENKLAGAMTEERARVRQLVVGCRSQQRLLRSQLALEELAAMVVTKDLPREILAKMLQGIGSRMSELCYELGQPYQIAIDDELELLVKHVDGTVEAVQRLSGGQRACVATVFWLVRLLGKIGSGLPVLVLDEPSAHMDSTVVAQFGHMLQRLGPLLIERKLQVILITHHEQLAGCAQQVIRLG